MKDKKMQKDSVGKEQRKSKYGTGACIKWLLNHLWQWDKSMVWVSLLMVPVSVILYAIGLYLPSGVLGVLEKGEQFNRVALTILVLLGAQLFFQLIKDWLGSYHSVNEHLNKTRPYYELTKMECKQDYYLIYSEENRTLNDRAYEVMGFGSRIGLGKIWLDTVGVISNSICFFLFGSVISFLSPWIILLLIGESLITFFVRRWKSQREHFMRDEQAVNDGKFYYLASKLSNEPKAGKDIRLYNMVPFLEEKGKILMGEHIRILRRKQTGTNVLQFTGFLTTAVRDGLAYGILIQRALGGEIDAAGFVLYFSAISQMSGFIEQIINYIGSLLEMQLKISDCIEFIDEERGRLNHGKGIPIPKGRPLSVEFRNVTYRYPKGDKNVLENVSFRIEPGEKISLVGLNGAGKTTLTKLMCGLILPDEGQVLIDGRDVLEYNCEELYSLFAMVPQEYTVLPTTIAENVTFCERKNIDEKRLWECLEKAGIAEKIRSLEKGIDTPMERRLDADAVQFSGGEMQKILLARALYRNVPMLILDEPTAALDPLAEDRMYRKYSEMAKGATSVFISHRLASTRFCDRIYLLDGAHFAECGTHEELMALGGRYRELYDVQSKYYREEGEVNEA